MIVFQLIFLNIDFSTIRYLFFQKVFSACINIRRPVTLIYCWVKDKPSLTTLLKMCSTNTLAETLGTISFCVESISMITWNIFTNSGYRGTGCGNMIFMAVFIIDITSRSRSTLNSVRPITLIIRWTI